MKADADAELERLKNSLQMSTIEHKVRFSRLHERRAEVIAAIYERLVNAHNQSSFFLFSFASFDTKERFAQYNRAYKANYDTLTFIDANKIFIPASVCGMLNEYMRSLNHAVINTQAYAAVEASEVSSLDELRKGTEALRQAHITFEDQVPKLRGALEMEFRALLGDR
jgi:hypothetical protein